MSGLGLGVHSSTSQINVSTFSGTHCIDTLGGSSSPVTKAAEVVLKSGRVKEDPAVKSQDLAAVGTCQRLGGHVHEARVVC